MMSMDATRNSDANRNGPMNSSSPSASPTRFSNGVSTGPKMAPSVPTTTTLPMAFARSCGSARSAAT